jgi:hypothetical protein
LRGTGFGHEQMVMAHRCDYVAGNTCVGQASGTGEYEEVSMKLPENFKAQIGGNFYTNTPKLIVCRDETLLQVDRDEQTGSLHVWLKVFDANGKRKAVIEDTRFVKGRKTDFKVRMTDSAYIVRECKSGRVVCEIRRSGASRENDIDVFVMTHSQDGFFVHANPKQSNTGVKADGRVHSDLEAALVLN